MSILTSGKTWTDREQVTAALLNQMFAGAVFDDAALSPTLEVDAGSGKLKVKDSGIDSAQIKDFAVVADKIADEAVTAAKLADDGVTEQKLADGAVGNTKLADGAVTADKLGADVHRLMYSGVTGTLDVTSSFQDFDLSAVVGANRALVMIEVWGGSIVSIFFRKKGASANPYNANSFGGYGAGGVVVGTSNRGGYVFVETDAAGIAEVNGNTTATGINYRIVSYQVMSV